MGCFARNTRINAPDALGYMILRGMERRKIVGVHSEMVDFGVRQGPREFSTADIARYFEG